jgi:hypothetical protein
MSVVVAHQTGTESDFEAIELAVMETERGRWFLDQYASRNRHADTQVLLTALSRIEKSIAIHREPTEIDKFRLDVLEMSRAIAKTHAEIAAIKPDEIGGGRIFEASGELDSIVSATEHATSEILAAAEKIQETAWTLRESGVDGAICDGLDERATEVYMACSFQDLTAQRIRKVIDALGFLEKRVNTMVDIWQFAEHPDDETSQKPDLKAGLALDPSMSQADVDYALVQDSANTASVDFDSVELDMAHPISQPEVAQFHKSYLDMDNDVFAVDRNGAADSEEILVGQEIAIADNAVTRVHEQPFSPPVIHDDVDEMLFTAQSATDISEVSVAPNADASAVVPASHATIAPAAGDHLQLVHSQTDVDDAIRKVRTGSDLSAEEAAKALDALKRMSVEDRTRLFS